jgi:GPH family glycoside/pentoside/hexuronide:cation symporter
MSSQDSDYDKPVSFNEKVAYGMGDTASNFFFHTFNIILLNYYVQDLGISAAAIALMFAVTKVFDAFTDPIMGMIADRTHTKWGHFRPYILWTAIPFGVIGWAMFANPDLSQDGKLIYAYVTYSAMMLMYTIINVPYSSLLGVISHHPDERDTIASYRFVLAFAAQFLIGLLVIPMRNYFGDGDNAEGYKYTMGIFAVLSILMWLYTFSATKERIKNPPSQKSDLMGDLKVLLKNGPWIALVVCGLFTLMNLAVRGGATLFYLDYYAKIGTETMFWIFDRTSIFFTSGTVAMIIGAAVSKPLMQKFSKRNLMMVLTALHGLIIGLFFFIPPGEYWLMLGVNFMATLVIGPTPAIVWAMYADCADYGEWKHGRRTTGLVFSGVIFSQKMGLAIGASLASMVLFWFGFVEGSTDQSADAIFGIKFMFCILPGVLLIVAALAVLFYPITNQVLKTMEEELDERRKKAAEA